MIAEIMGAVLGAGVLGIGYLVWCLFEDEAQESYQGTQDEIHSEERTR